MASKININEVFLGWPGRYLLVALLVNLVIVSWLSGVMPDAETWFVYILGAFFIVAAGYIIRELVQKDTLISTGIIAALAYIVYSVIMTFLKISGEPFSILNEIQVSGSFGLITMATTAIMRYFGK